MRKRKIPIRKCIGCGESKEKKELIRITHNKSGEIKLDLTGKAHGRGAYICRKKTCIEQTSKTKALNRAFRTEVPQAIYDDLIKEIGDGGSES